MCGTSSMRPSDSSAGGHVSLALEIAPAVKQQTRPLALALTRWVTFHQISGVTRGLVGRGLLNHQCVLRPPRVCNLALPSGGLWVHRGAC